MLVHSPLGLEWGATAGERLYQEEEEGATAPERQRHLNPKQANIIVCDEDPTASLVEEARRSPEDIRGLGDGGLGDVDPGRALQPRWIAELFARPRVSEDQLREAAEECAGGGAIRGKSQPRSGRRGPGPRGQVRASARAPLPCTGAAGR